MNVCLCVYDACNLVQIQLKFVQLFLTYVCKSWKMQPMPTTSEMKTGMEVGISERLENDIPIKTEKLGAFPPPHLFHEYTVYTVFCGRAIPTLDGLNSIPIPVARAHGLHIIF